MPHSQITDVLFHGIVSSLGRCIRLHNRVLADTMSERGKFTILGGRRGDHHFFPDCGGFVGPRQAKSPANARVGRSATMAAIGRRLTSFEGSSHKRDTLENRGPERATTDLQIKRSRRESPRKNAFLGLVLLDLLPVGAHQVHARDG